jgi:CheY-like chemotaxis protein
MSHLIRTSHSVLPYLPQAQHEELRPSCGLALLQAQLRGVERLLLSSRQTPLPHLREPLSREQRLDRSRRRDALDRELAAMQQQAARQLQQAGKPAHRGPRVVLAHRNDWFRSQLAGELTGLGFYVVAEVSDGADASGITAAEQPDVLFVEDRLPSFSGLEVIRRALSWCSTTMPVAEVLHPAAMGSFLDAGVRAAWVRGTSARAMAQGLAQHLRSPVALADVPA